MVSEKELIQWKLDSTLDSADGNCEDERILMLIEDLEEARRLLKPFADAVLGRANLSRVDLLAAVKYLSGRGVK